MQFDTLKLNKEFRRLYGRGKSAVSPVLVVYSQKNRLGYCRIGITAGKKVGCAVLRNRAKRKIVAAFRALHPFIEGSYDIVFVARGRTPFVKSTEVGRFMKKQFRNVGISLNESKNI